MVGFLIATVPIPVIKDDVDPIAILTGILAMVFNSKKYFRLLKT